MDGLAQRAIELAESLLREAIRVRTARERADAAQLARMMNDDAGRDFTLAMVDRVFRSRDPRKQAESFRGFLHRLGVPKFFSRPQRMMLRAGGIASRVAPQWVMPMIQSEIRRNSASVILPAEPEALAKYLEQRRASGIRVNVNPLG